MAQEGRTTDGSGNRLGATPGRVFVVIAGALLIAVLLNAPWLEDEAERQPFGKERDFWVAVWKPFAAVSRALYLDRPRAWATDALGHDDGGDVFELPASGGLEPGDPTGSPGGAPKTATRSTGKTPTPTATPTPPKQLVRTPDAASPLRVWVGGDSMSKILGEALVRQVSESGVMTPAQESQLSSGLTRPDFFDWPGHLNGLISGDAADVYVVMFGANDAQGIKTPGGEIFQPGDAGWATEYRRRVAGVMDLLKQDGRLVIWVGQPIMRSAEFSERMAELNVIYQEEAAKRYWIRYVDIWPLFVTANGSYDAYIVDDDGEVKLMRHPDGVHLVREGGEKAARLIMTAIQEEAGLIPKP
ncbi:MAG TPA: DUF459 domain-containing protein [Tepidiformaceae bacterium]|nr:DUF459 domain-containing protein [Tepidiformaceae bacterium]